MTFHEKEVDGSYQEEDPYYGDEDIKQDDPLCESEHISEAIENLYDAIIHLQGIEDNVAMSLIHIIDYLKIEWDIEK